MTKQREARQRERETERLVYTAVEAEREAAKEGSIFFELVVIVTVMQMMAGKASVQTYIASTSAEHLSVCLCVKAAAACVRHAFQC